MLKKIFIICSMIILLSFSLGCSPAALFVGGGTIVGTTAAQERSVGSALDDTSVWIRIKNAFFVDKEGERLFSRIGVKVTEGRVLLTGTLDTQEERLKALKLVWAQTGVREVINEISVGKNNPSLKTLASDSWITTQIKSKLFVSRNISSINYSIETIDSVVYIMGIAKNEEELHKVTEISGKVRSVKKVISYVRIKDSSARKEMLKRYD